MYLFNVEDYLIQRNASCSESDVWIDKPTVKGSELLWTLYYYFFNSNLLFIGTILYSIITPCVCLIGICGNILSLIVLSKNQFRSSIYTYLCGKSRNCIILKITNGYIKYNELFLFMGFQYVPL